MSALTAESAEFDMTAFGEEILASRAILHQLPGVKLGLNVRHRSATSAHDMIMSLKSHVVSVVGVGKLQSEQFSILRRFGKESVDRRFADLGITFMNRFVNHSRRWVIVHLPKDLEDDSLLERVSFLFHS